MMYKYPYFLLIALSLLIINKSLLLAESNSSIKSETTVAEADSTKKELTKEEPEIVLPLRKKIRNTIILKGFIEDPDALPISIDTQNWSDLRITVPPVHGKELKKGEVLMELDMEKIRTHIQFLTHDLNILELNKEILQAEIKLAEELAPLEKAEIDRFENYVKEDFNRYKNIYLPFDKKSADLNLKSSEQYLANAAEELNQLKKMYEADDLTEETEEIILQRAQHQYERAKFSFEAAKIRNEEAMKVQLPRGKVSTESNFNREKLSIQTLRKIKPAELNRKKLEGKKMVEERKQFAINKGKVERDLKLMSPIKSPFNGTLFWGTFDRGKWSGGNAFKSKLRKGGILKPNEVFATVCPSNRIQARLNLPEKNLHQIKVGNEAVLTLLSADDSKIPSSIKSISPIPVLPGIFDLTADVIIPKGFIPPAPGSACSLECVTYHREDAITIPANVIHSETNDPDSKFVYILNNKGKTQKKMIELGKKSGDMFEILSGVRMGMKVLKNKP
ncbi:MAG: HlyD family efflux transporter periplasmic adaptor subunit [Verrucomicrobiota bacterium]|nr:HlyD family efflux transporter periplasmic adaptor subunit [Verrucomicrobiota bacterium]